MIENKQRGRRRATPIKQTGRRRATPIKQSGRRRATAPPKRRIITNESNTPRNLGVAVVTGSLLLTMAVTPSTINTAFSKTDNNEVSNSDKMNSEVSRMMLKIADGSVTADPNAKISFAAPVVKSSVKVAPAPAPKPVIEQAGQTTVEPVALQEKVETTLKVKAAEMTTESSKGTLSAPLQTLVPSSAYGMRVNPLTGAAGEFHRGKDFAVTCGTQVLAAASGVVTFAGWHEYGGGNRIVVDHGNGLATTYNHNSSLTLKVGDKVTRGDVVALSGTTGNSTGCHLHFEVMVNDDVVDPDGWL